MCKAYCEDILPVDAMLGKGCGKQEHEHSADA